MQLVVTGIAVLAGMAFSLGIALLVEEVIFGKVLVRVFASQSAGVKASQHQ
jgi:ABC-type sugar transport system permease subunit